LCSSFWPNTSLLSCSSRHTHHRSRTVWVFVFPRQENSEMTLILGNGGPRTKFDEDAIKHPEKGVRKMFPTVEETLDELCSCGRELCWRQKGLKPISLIYFMYCGQSRYLLNKSRIYNLSLKKRIPFVTFNLNYYQNYYFICDWL